jgi:hypothetical protein
MPTEPMPSVSPLTAAKRSAGKLRAMNTVHTRKAGAQPTPVSTWPGSAPESRCQRRDQPRRRPPAGTRQHRAAHALHVDAHAHEQLQRTEGEVEGAGEQPSCCGDRPKACCSGAAMMAATVRKAWLRAKPESAPAASARSFLSRADRSVAGGDSEPNRS